MLAQRIDWKNGAQPNNAEAVKLVSRGQCKGTTFAQLSLAVVYRKGEGAAIDHAEAFKWAKMAATQGNAQAQVIVGSALLMGEGAPRDYSEAAQLGIRAATQGAAAFFPLEESPTEMVSASRGQRRSGEVVQTGRCQGDAAMAALGKMHYQGVGLPKNPVEAMTWFRMAAAKGDVEAQLVVGNAYRTGDGVPQDYQESLKWLLQAAENGNDGAQILVGNAYGEGLG